MYTLKVTVSIFLPAMHGYETLLHWRKRLESKVLSKILRPKRDEWRDDIRIY